MLKNVLLAVSLLSCMVCFASEPGTEERPELINLSSRPPDVPNAQPSVLPRIPSPPPPIEEIGVREVLPQPVYVPPTYVAQPPTIEQPRSIVYQPQMGCYCNPGLIPCICQTTNCLINQTVCGSLKIVHNVLCCLEKGLR